VFLGDAQVSRMRAERVQGWKYSQERKARFVMAEAGGNAVFRREWLAKCMVDAIPKREGFRTIVFGIDVARLGNDATAYVGVDDSSGDVLHVERHKKKLGREIVQDMLRLSLQFPGCRFVVDDTGHRGYVTDFSESHLNVEGTQFSRQKEKWVMGLVMLMQMGRIQIPDPDLAVLPGEMREDVRTLIEEMLAFQKIESNQGRIEWTHPPGGHDDVLDALMMATMSLAKRMQGTLGVDGTRNAMDSLGI
jgi:hypothetical protein